jgi:flagellar protein FliS
MPGSAQSTYLEDKILNADPMELVCILYRAAKDAVASARTHLAASHIAEKGRQVSKALAILAELTASLDHAGGNTLSRSLAELYDYMQRRLLDASLRQRPEPLGEVESLLGTLLEGWEEAWRAGQTRAVSQARPERRDAYTAFDYGPDLPGAFLSAEPATGHARQSWSF